MEVIEYADRINLIITKLLQFLESASANSAEWFNLMPKVFFL